MVGISVFLLLSFCFFYFLTRQIWIKLIKNDSFIIEIHFPIIAIQFSKNTEAESTRIKSKKREQSSLLKYPRMLSTVYNLLEDCEIEITEFILPIKDSNAKYYKYHALLFSALAYLRTKVQKLFIHYDGLVLSLDATDFSFDLTIKTELYKFIHSWWKFNNITKRRRG